ncbi:hypothetical protein HN011_001901 [Eciton burchellii]|nr:hypothetical protein HN011_001901 [Eciton burchellii]
MFYPNGLQVSSASGNSILQSDVPFSRSSLASAAAKEAVVKSAGHSYRLLRIRYRQASVLDLHGRREGAGPIEAAGFMVIRAASGNLGKRDYGKRSHGCSHLHQDTSRRRREVPRTVLPNR